MRIRIATASDAEEGSYVLRRSIVELCGADHNGDYEAISAWIANKTPESWAAWVKQDATTLYVATNNERIVGVGMLTDAGEILLNYVAPDARWCGVSKSMLAYMEAEAIRRGVSECRLESTVTARPFYEAHGYLTDPKASGAGSWMSKCIATAGE
jgi:GNAT superfamily N-acetyltransferase